MRAEQLHTITDDVLRTQVCVVGAGVVGRVVARELATRGVTVLVVEHNQTPSAPTEFAVTSTDFDVTTRPWVSRAGWPIPAQTIAAYSARALSYLGLAPPPTPESVGAALCPIAGQVTAANPVDLPDVRIVDATAIHLDTDATGAHVYALELSGLGGRRCLVEAKVFVLAMGAIETPRLLLASRRTLPSGVGNRYDQVGRYLQDRRHGVVARLSPAAAAAAFTEFRNGTPGFALSATVQRDERLLGCAMWFREAAKRGSMKVALDRLLRGKASASDVSIIGGGATGWAWRTAGLPRLGGVDVHAVVEQAPDFDSRVRLSDNETDAFHVPVAEIDPDDRQLATLRRALDLLTDEFARRDWPAPNIDPTPTLTAVNEPTGTTRMSTNPRDGVVDGQCRVHGVDNLYIAGPSVFPTTGHADPTLAAVALAIRLADTIAARMAATRLG
ncbi:GMC oxidoreductase [Nocardia camponoti]|uniref:GMC oxidoreductase n=1 Tax=Nocardia camponoti TaxID=1616106 RepID=A0A917VFM7_9NOCA|nr:GMC oxidoreductase [Nocardia camponoti]GGK69750.1 GMC oxidoreductase [Nocardia camponoti]